MALAEKDMVKYPHISIDEKGVARLEGRRITVRHLAVDHVRLGLSPAEIAANYEGLMLAQVHSALAYYFDHKDEMDADIERRQQRAEKTRKTSPNPVTRAQLEERLRRRQTEENDA